MKFTEVEGPRSEVLITAQGLVQRSLPFLRGVRRLASLRLQLPGEQANSDFLLLAGVASEADHIPEEAARPLCSAPWLAQCDNEAKELEAHYEGLVLAACNRIIERHSGVA